MNEKKFEKKCPGPIDCFGDRDVLFRKVLIPMAIGDDTKFPPKNGAYRNSLVVYEANGAIYIYSSDGLYTKLSVAAGVNSVNGMYGDVILDIPSKLSQLQNDMGYITKDVDNLTNYTKTSGFNNVAFSGSYLDLSNKPAINNGQLTINRNGSTVGSFKANQAENTTVNIKVPVYTNELINNSQFVQDAHYVHTDNNFNNEWKSKLAHLADIQTIGNNLTLTNGRLDATVPPSGVTSVNGKTGAVVLDASDVHALPDTTVIPTVNDATLTIQKNGVTVATFSANSPTNTIANITTSDDIVITLGVDGGGNMVWSGADSISDIRTAFNNGGSLRVEAPVLTDEIYNVTEIWWKDSNHDALIVQSVDNDAALVQIELADDYSAVMGNVNLQERLQAGANITINGNTISASVPAPITVDSALDNTSPNPVQNQALYPAIVPTEIYKTVYTYDWTGPAGTNIYNCVAILTMPAGTFTSNSLVELGNDDGFNNFAKHGFVLYGSEVSTQRLWITSIGKPTGTVSLKFRIYKWGN